MKNDCLIKGKNMANKKINQSLTKNGRPMYKSYSKEKLIESLEKTNRLRDKDKIQRMINNFNAR